jgi:plasmid maintenance system antidote protein VapI
MPKSSDTELKAPLHAMTDDRKLEIAAQFTDDVLSKLAAAFVEVVQKEGWGKRDLASISGMNETAIGHILAGRRKNLTVETIAILTRAMRKRPELTLHDLRPSGNNQPEDRSAATARSERQGLQAANISRARHLSQSDSLSQLELVE